MPTLPEESIENLDRVHDATALKPSTEIIGHADRSTEAARTSYEIERMEADRRDRLSGRWITASGLSRAAENDVAPLTGLDLEAIGFEVEPDVRRRLDRAFFDFELSEVETDHLRDLQKERWFPERVRETSPSLDSVERQSVASPPPAVNERIEGIATELGLNLASIVPLLGGRGPKTVERQVATDQFIAILGRLDAESAELVPDFEISSALGGIVSVQTLRRYRKRYSGVSSI